MAAEPRSPKLRDLLITTKDGDWGKGQPEPGTVPYRVIRGADFPQARLGDIAEIPKCYLNAETVHRRTLQADDIIIETAGGNRDRPTGRTLLVTQRLLDSLDLPTTCASFCRFLRVNPKLAEPHYVFWYLQWLYIQGAMWEHQVQHTGVARFQYTRFAETTPIPLPDRTDQRAIACILGSMDDKIELNRRMNRTLEEMARAIFKSWFVDFGPVRAKAAVRREHPKWTDEQVNRAAYPKVKPEIARLFPDGFEDSELGKIPKGWAISTVDEAFELTMGQSPPGETYNETGDGLPFYQGRADFGFRFPKRRVFCTAPTRLARRGDTLVSVRAPVGDINMASEDCAIGRGVGSIRHKSGSRSFTYYSMRALESQFEVFEAEGTVFGSISKKDFHRLAVVVPPKNLVAQFERLSCPFDDAIECNEQESGTLAALRDALLPKLVSGELRVPDAERIAARCA